MEKKLFSISFKYEYFKPIFNYTKKGLWKGTLIYQNCDTLMCFSPKEISSFINKNRLLEICQPQCHMWNATMVIKDYKVFTWNISSFENSNKGLKPLFIPTLLICNTTPCLLCHFFLLVTTMVTFQYISQTTKTHMQKIHGYFSLTKCQLFLVFSWQNLLVLVLPHSWQHHKLHPPPLTPYVWLSGFWVPFI